MALDLRPVAAPVDSFVRPAQSPLLGLAEGLGQFDQGIKALLSARSEEDAAKAQAEGQMAFYKNNQQGYAEAVRTGAIPSFASKHFVDAYKQAEGDLLGSQLSAEFASAWDAFPDKGSDDPAVFNGFMSDFFKGRLGENIDPGVWKGLQPHINGIVAGGTQGYIKARHEATYKGAVDAGVAQGNRTLQEDRDKALEAGKEINWSDTWGKVMATREQYVSQGLRGEDFDAKMMDAVVVKALETGDRQFLSFFQQKVPGKDYTYAETPEGQAKLADARDRLDTQERVKLGQDAAIQNRQDKIAEDAATNEAVEFIFANPGQPVPEDILARGQKVNPKFRVQVTEWRNTASQSDAAALRQVYSDIMEGGGTEVVKRAMKSGASISTGDLASAYNFAKSFEENREVVGRVVGGQAAGYYLGAIAKRTTDNDFVDPTTGLTAAGIDATFEFRNQLTRWVLENPNAGPLETDKAIKQIGDSILGRITDTGMGETPRFLPENGQGAPQTGATPQPGGTTTQQPNDGQQPSQPQQTAPGQQGNAQGAAQWFLGLDRATRDQIEQSATKLGVPLPQAIEKLYQRQGQPQAQPERRSSLDPTGMIIPAAYAAEEDPGSAFDGNAALDAINEATGVRFTPEQAMQLLDGLQFDRGADIASDPGAARILDFISQFESRGNWNAVFGNGNSRQDLSVYSLDEIMQMQRERVRRGSPSSATGRYQFMRNTLRGLKDELGLTGNEKFTPELQNLLAVALLERRGYNEWRAGRISTSEFARRLSQEWAALPNPRTGRSYYAGDGLNKSLTRTSTVLSALEAARNID